MKTLIPIIPTISYKNNKVEILDQTKLPLKENYIVTDDYKIVCNAMKDLSVRGAPALGVTGAYACVIAANKIYTDTLSDFKLKFNDIANKISSTRPTAVNLSWSVEKIKKIVKNWEGDTKFLKSRILKEANDIKNDDISRCHRLCDFGSELISQNSNLITICNTGGLATSGIGTGLGVIQYAQAKGRNPFVYVCETRPLLQGSRLNTWELNRTKTSFSLITDSMAAHIMKTKNIDGIFVGADRIASNGDTANKIGTYSLAVLAKHHGIPFYVVAPLSTVDFKISSGKSIVIEIRDNKELTRMNNIPFTTENFSVTNPAFDVTPSKLIKGIVTEKGIAKYPYLNSLTQQNNGK